MGAHLARVRETHAGGWRAICRCGWVGKHHYRNDRRLADAERARHRRIHADEENAA